MLTTWWGRGLCKRWGKNAERNLRIWNSAPVFILMSWSISWAHLRVRNKSLDPHALPMTCQCGGWHNYVYFCDFSQWHKGFLYVTGQNFRPDHTQVPLLTLFEGLTNVLTPPSIRLAGIRIDVHIMISKWQFAHTSSSRQWLIQLNQSYIVRPGVCKYKPLTNFVRKTLST